MSFQYDSYFRFKLPKQLLENMIRQKFDSLLKCLVKPFKKCKKFLNGGNKKTKQAKFSKKQTFVTPRCAHVYVCIIRWQMFVLENFLENLPGFVFFLPPFSCAYQGVTNVRFSENLACFLFWLPPFWDSPVCFIADKLFFI